MIFAILKGTFEDIMGKLDNGINVTDRNCNFVVEDCFALKRT